MQYSYDVPALLLIFHLGRSVEDGGEEAERDIFSDDEGEYSILPHLYAYLTTGMDDNDIV